MSDYQAGSANQPLEIIDVARLEAAARQVLPKGTFDYIAHGAAPNGRCGETGRPFTTARSTRACSAIWKSRTPPARSS